MYVGSELGDLHKRLIYHSFSLNDLVGSELGGTMTFTSQEYDTTMNDPTSLSFLNTQEWFCNEMTRIMTQGESTSNFDSCRVDTIRSI